MVEHERRTWANFAHVKNIEVGRARIIFDEQRNAWALPGRRYTADRVEALLVASAIDKIIRSGVNL